ncbi:MAG TPA: bifunctional phosphoribosylaminoimidazolecarboxamide formyltransferase/IMP cyclohydrolase [Planctomycetes bacterium]|nr:bifunctional phosphoribosylaminoimidazolecarboxamide formyltransferase/IMP cyclohydrolase [Planctomycetota bacterium]
MTQDVQTIRRALLSAFEKDGIVELARALDARGVEILSTGGTARLLRDAGLPVTDVAEVTGFPEMMDGRVKTLHPRVHGGLLMRRDVEDHCKAAAENGIQPIDLVVINLYPFEKAAADEASTRGDVVEMIDIGGPSMVRSAAKNHDFVTVIVDPSDYAAFLAEFETNDGGTTFAFRARQAAKAFATTAAYDRAIAAWMSADAVGDEEEFLPSTLNVILQKSQDLRYGENPHQRAALYLGADPGVPAVSRARQLNGKALSFNNYLDASSAFDCVRSFDETAVAVIKHKNPCGAALRPGAQLEAFLAAYEGDPLSAYGGIVAFNEALSEDTARAVATKDHFFEVVVAPAYEGDAVEILRTGAKWGKNCRILETGVRAAATQGAERELRWIRGGVLVQDPDASSWPEVKVVTRRAPTEQEMADLRFAWLVAPHVTSNAIIFAKDRALVGVGAGQMSRVDAVEIAAKKGGEKCRGAVMASDAFFPFADGILAAHAAGVQAVVQPGGSIRDAKVTAACDEAGIAMVLTGQRHFRH